MYILKMHNKSFYSKFLKFSMCYASCTGDCLYQGKCKETYIIIDKNKELEALSCYKRTLWDKLLGRNRPDIEVFSIIEEERVTLKSCKVIPDGEYTRIYFDS